MSQPGDLDEEHARFLLETEDVSCLVADALAELGVGGYAQVPGLFPLGSGRRACGPALTVRYEIYQADGGPAAERQRAAAFDFPALFGSGRPGAIAVFDCPVQDAAVLGGRGASWASRFGMAGCVVNGAVRDVEALTAGDVPVWARHVSPAAGRGALIQAELGGAVKIGNAVVNAGDIVVADGNGLTVIPAARLDAVMSRMADLKRAEDAAAAAFEAG